MGLTIGTQFGSHEILSLLGKGGMGEVYRARDLKLKREVAIKILPDEFSLDPDRVSRFQREAELLASLNHPNIAAIYDLAEVSETRFLVLELVEGKTLAEVIASRGALPVEEALNIAIQICDALETAHQKGVIHRDLKPANIKIAPDGKVKLLDFGLARIYQETPTQELSDSPTLLSRTGGGVILGTPSYSSPEQARGRAVDKRSDIWAFGCVLYEMLTGRQAFGGSDVSEIFAAVIRAEPDWNHLRPNLHPRLTDLLKQCVNKTLKERWHDIADVRIELEKVLANRQPDVSLRSGNNSRHTALLWVFAVATVAAICVAVWAFAYRSPGSHERVQFAVSLESSIKLLTRDHSPSLAISPDGTKLVYSGVSNTGSMLYLRYLDQIAAKPIPGTEGGQTPFFSPDSKLVGFVSDGYLNKVSLEGGRPSRICKVGAFHVGDWDENDRILFTNSHNSGLSVVSASGGEPKALTTPSRDAGERSHVWPQFLPGGHEVLFSVWKDAGGNDAELQVLSLETGSRHKVADGSWGRYLPSGHLVFSSGGVLHAAPFNSHRQTVIGSSMPVLESIHMEEFGAPSIAISVSGTLAFVPGNPLEADRMLVWVSRDGSQQPLADTARPSLGFPRISRDGSRVAITVGVDRQIWIYDITRSNFTRISRGGGVSSVVWSPDGQRLAYTIDGNLTLQAPEGAGAGSQVVATGVNEPHSWSLDGKFLLLRYYDSQTLTDIWSLKLDGSSKPEPFVRDRFQNWGAIFSPDGKWVAYVSNESGQNQVYLLPFSGGGQRRQISTLSGESPVWGPDGHELFYWDGIETMMIVQMLEGPGGTLSMPKPLFRTQYEATRTVRRNYDLSPDGKRFLFTKRVDGSQVNNQINVVLNWLDELKQRVPVH
jgi:serine/threonine-protein kinase